MSLYTIILLYFLLVILTIYMVNRNFKIYYLYGLILYQTITIIPSIIYIETGKYIAEQGKTGYYVGAVWYYAVFYLITLLIVYATHNTLKKIKLTTFELKINHKPFEEKAVIVIVSIVFFLLFFNLAQSPIPLFGHVSRFDFWKYAKFPILGKIFGNTAMFLPFALGILFKKFKKLSISGMLLYIIYNFLIGQKFSPILSGSFSFFLPLVLASKTQIKLKSIIKLKFIIPALLVVFSAYKVIYNKYEKIHPFAVIKIYNPNEAILYRIFGLQGHLFWGATETFAHRNMPNSWNPLELNYGMHKMMRYFSNADKEKLEQNMKGGFSYTNAYPAVLFMIFPVSIAYLFHILIVIFILSLSGWILMKLITNHSYLFAIISFQFYIWTIYALTMGYFYKLKFGILFNLIVLGLSYYYEQTKKIKHE